MQENTKTNRFVFLDFAKGIAIFSILLFHFFRHVDGLPSFWLQILMLGGVGVHVFLLASGIGVTLKWKNIEKKLTDKEVNLDQCISEKYSIRENVCEENVKSISKEKQKWRKFLKTTRLFYTSQIPKIYIPYLTCICVIAGWSTLFPSRGVETSRFHFFSHVFGYKMFFTNLIESYGFHFWFLSTIFQFYFIFPFLVKLFEIIPKKNQRILLGCSYLISLGRMWYIATQGLVFNRVWTAAFPMFLGEFCLGIRIGGKILETQSSMEMRNQQEKQEEYFLATIKNSKRYVVIVPIFCLLGYVGITLFGGNVGRAFNDVFAIGRYGGMCLLVRYFLQTDRGRESVGEKIKRYFDHVKTKITAFFVFLGRFSYTLYLWHGFLFLLFLRTSIYLNIKLTFLRILGGSVVTILIIVKGHAIFMRYVKMFGKN